ncbi:MAG: hypothetical protein JW894_02285 [Bacteroidales bacterium]|nr:hypothetical protein [Bacteroidales bacterium]
MKLDSNTLYSEAGNMIRHYSSVRIGILSFLLPVSFTFGGAIINFIDNIPLLFYLIITEFIIYLIASVSAIYFTSKQNYLISFLIEIEHKKKIKELYNRIQFFSFRKYIHLDIFDWFLIIGGFILHIGLYVFILYHMELLNIK